MQRQESPNLIGPFKTIGIIAIDGPSSSGKGTIAKKIASHFKLVCLNTGGLYRALAYLALEQKLDLNKNETKIIALTQQLNEFDLESPLIHNEEIGKAASIVALNQNIRRSIFNLQRNFALEGIKQNGGVVLEGRDIGTVICPDARYKFFVTASSEIRARRRYQQLLESGAPTDYQLILEQLKKRDQQDRNRSFSPLKKAADAIEIDSSELTIEEVFHKILSYIQN